MTFEQILDSGNYHLIDVREPMELEIDGQIEGAINIPLGTIPVKIDQIKELKDPKIIFCRSGGRSGQACQFLEQNGFTDVYNGGGFVQVNAMLKNHK